MPIGLSLAKGLHIAGIVRDVRARGLLVEPRPTIYTQAGDRGWNGTQPRTTYILRVAATSVRVGSWERVIHGVDPFAVVLDSGDIQARLDRSIRNRTFATLVVGLFACASLLVAAAGLGSVVAYTVVTRTREIAIRLALGATGERVTGLVVFDAMTAGACGVAGGVLASVRLSRALESLLYGVRPADPMTLLVEPDLHAHLVGRVARFKYGDLGDRSVAPRTRTGMTRGR